MTSKIDDSHFARLKQRIGYNAEPVRDAHGYWVVGYGRRLNDTPGGPKPETYWSEQYAEDELRYRLEHTPDEVPQARALAAMGRGGDTEIAHLTLGEIILPAALQTPEVMHALSHAAARAGVSLGRFRLGMPENRINPNTGVAEFGVFDWVGNALARNKASAIPITDEERTMAGSGDPEGFWRSRDALGDPVARHALNSLHPQNDIADHLFGGSSINDRLDAFSRVYAGHDADLPAIRNDLMKEHVSAVDQDTNAAEGVPGLLKPRQIYDYHQRVFGKYGLPTTAYGGSPFTGSAAEADILSPLYCLNCDK